MPRLDRIVIYPIKALDGVIVPRARVRRAGGLEGDREFAMAGADGRFINGKRDARVHRLRALFDLDARVVSLRAEGAASAETFHLLDDRPRMEAWLADYFGRDVRLVQDPTHGFPDASEDFGPTLVCTETLAEVASWFPGIDLEQARRRFRPNLELGGAEPFWEDRLVADGRVVGFRIGTVSFEGVEPWPRCAVPTRDPTTGAEDRSFQKTFVERRRATLPAWAPAGRFDHYYRLCVGTRVPASEVGKELRTGDILALP